MNTQIEARPVSGELGPSQQAAVDGPWGPAMQTYICAGCKGQFPDMGSYFYGKPSVRCIWCTKFPKGTKK